MPRVTFILRDGARREIDAKEGETLLRIAWDNDIDIEGACGGVMACSTCHLIVDPVHINRLAAPEVEEADMLDLAWGLTPTSRLGCQIVLSDGLDGLVVTLAPETRNLLDG